METAITLSEKDFIQKDESFWMTADQLGKWLGYQKGTGAISNILRRHEKELSPFSSTFKMKVQGQDRDVRMFDEQGCYILAMHASTPEAARFRYELSLFLKQLRINSGRFAELFDKYEALRVKIQMAEFHDFVYKNYSLSPVHQARLIELIPSLTVEELMRLFRLSKEFVDCYLHCYSHIQRADDYDFHTAPWPDTAGKRKEIRNDEILNLLKSGVGKTEISRRLRVHRNTIYNVMREAGLSAEVSHVSQ